MSNRRSQDGSFVGCDLPFSLPSTIVLKTKKKTLSYGIYKRKGTERNLVFIGFPSHGITWRGKLMNSIIYCGNLKCFEVLEPWPASWVNREWDVGSSEPSSAFRVFLLSSYLLFFSLILPFLRFLLHIDQRRVQCSRSDNSSAAQGFLLNFRDWD